MEERRTEHAGQPVDERSAGLAKTSRSDSRGLAGTETSVTLDEDGGYRLTFAAADPDGDPVLVTVIRSPRPSPLKSPGTMV